VARERRLLNGGVLALLSARVMAVLVAVGAVVAVWGAGPARGGAIETVTTTADGDDGSCTAQVCTLRDAIKYSSAGDTVVVPAGTYNLTMGELSVGHDLTVSGAGVSSVTISGGNASRVLEVAASSAVTLSGVTVTAGSGVGTGPNDPVPDGEGGAVAVLGTLTLNDSAVTASTAGEGGGIYDDSTATITNTTIGGNTASSDGGGIYDDENATITNSTVTGNGAASDGGGIYDDFTATITNSTITGNTASTAGGGIYDDDTASVINATISGNTAPPDQSGSSGGANVFVNDTGSGGFENTIVSDPIGGGTDCYTSGEFPTSMGHNLEDDAAVQNSTESCQFLDPTDESSVDPMLGPLASNGGPTQTMALLAGSPGIDKAAAIPAITTDQRGGPRPQPPGGTDDIGAYEVGAVADMGISQSGSPNPVTVGQGLTYTLKVTNNGPSPDPAYAVMVTDALPAGVSFQSAAASQGSCTQSSGTVICNLGTVDQGASATMTIVMTPMSPGTVTNTATVASGAKDYNAANDSASTTTQVQSTTMPAVVAGPPTVLSSTGATFSGSVNPEGLSTTAYFEYGLDPKYSGSPGSIVYSSTTAMQQAGSDFSVHMVTATVTGLVPNALYHLRLAATNRAGTTFGPDITFVTAKGPAPGSPTLGKTFNISLVSGVVLVKVNGHFIPLTELTQIPKNTVIDARHGTLTLTSAAGSPAPARDTAAKGKKHKTPTQKGTFSGAIFKLSQATGGAGKGLVTLAIVENAFSGAPNYSSCKAHKAADPAATAASSRTLQLLHASAKGKFSTKGRYSAATVLGTKWTIADRCDGTLTHDITDAVAVTDFVRHKTIILHAGQSYLARARK